jgi:hypothetical protein
MATKALTTTSLRLCGGLSFCCDPQNSTAAQQLQKTVWEPAKSINKSVWWWDRIPQLAGTTYQRVLRRSSTEVLHFHDLHSETWAATNRQSVSRCDGWGIVMGAHLTWLSDVAIEKNNLYSQHQHVERQRMQLWYSHELLDMLDLLNLLNLLREVNPLAAFLFSGHFCINI